jgi:hypothetical protein
MEPHRRDRSIEGALGQAIVPDRYGNWFSGRIAFRRLLRFAATPRAHAETQQECQHHMPHIDHELRQAIEHHDVHSCEAEHDELNEAREGGWREHHPWWDEHKHGRHTQQDWDDPEHDRDDYRYQLSGRLGGSLPNV